MNQIVCLSTSPWFPIPTRKQQVMSRIAGAEILYFDPPVTWLAPLKDPEARKKLRACKAPAQQVQPGLYVYATPPVLPFFNKFRWINRLNQRRQARYIRRRMREHGFEKPVLWCYSPTACDCVAHVPHSGLVYDCVDKHSAYGGLMNPALVDRMEEDLARQADQCFATARGLAQRLSAFCPHTEMIPNGANYERFVRASLPQPVPEDFPVCKGPVFGFVGALQQCIEYGYVAHAAQARPDWSFVFIGAEKPGADLGALKGLPNCYFLGLKPNEQLPAYIARFDACLNLFGNNELSVDVSPLKFYEYLATGKPIVSTAMPLQVLDYAPWIHIARSEAEFITCCQAALADTDPARTQARIDQGKACSWDSRVQQITAACRARGLAL